VGGAGVRRHRVKYEVPRKCREEDPAGVRPEETEGPHAHDPAAGPQGPPGQGGKDQDPSAQGQSAAQGGLRPRVHHHAEEAELGAPEGGAGPVVVRHRGHRIHPRGRAQPAGALDRAGPRRPGEGPARRPLQDRPWHAGHPGCPEPQAGPQPLRREEGEELMPRTRGAGPARRGGGRSGGAGARGPWGARHEGELLMPRKGPAPKRPPITDPVYASPLVTQLVNKVLLNGKRSLAERIVYGAMEGCREKTGTDPVITLKRALDTLKRAIEVKSRRVGGATYQVPVEVRASRSTTLALRWLVQYSRARREKTMTERLMNELLDASNGLGASVKRREDTHKMAESNKAFAHYRW